MRILVVEDDAALARGLVAALRLPAWPWTTRPTASRPPRSRSPSPTALWCSIWACQTYPGFEVLRRIRRSGSTVPVMILTARDGVADRVRGLDLGADDYL